MSADDSALVDAARSGDRAAWARMYDLYADRLHDFCWSVLRDRDEAGDAVHDTFITAYRKLHQLRDPSRLRSWLFAIARNEALSHHRRQKRAVPTEELEVTAPGGGPLEQAETDELRDLVWAAAAGLADRDRAALDLHLRQGLEGAALGEALGTSASNANVLMSRLRDQVERSLGAYLVAKKGRADCAALDALLHDWDGGFTPLWRKRIARHVEDCPTCSASRDRMASPLALLSGVAVVPAPAALRDRVLDEIELISATRTVESTRTRRAAIAAAILAAAVLVLLGIAVLGDDSPTRRSNLATATTIDTATTALTDTTTGGVDTTVDEPARTNTTRRPATATTARPAATTVPPTTVVPQLFSVRASARNSTLGDANSCSANTTTPITATITGGARPIGAVMLHWQGPGSTSGSKRLTESNPTTWTGTLGPLFGQGNATWWVTAVDGAGTRAETVHQPITVQPCAN